MKRRSPCLHGEMLMEKLWKEFLHDCGDRYPEFSKIFQKMSYQKNFIHHYELYTCVADDCRCPACAAYNCLLFGKLEDMLVKLNNPSRY